MHQPTNTGLHQVVCTGIPAGVLQALRKALHMGVRQERSTVKFSYG